jgi:ribosomal protein S18 acetylase RimI-like enzyme
MLSLDRQTCVSCAQSTEVFRPAEIAILEEVLQKSYTPEDVESTGLPQDGYLIYEEKHGEDLVGFIIFGKTPLTHANWDIYWVAVNKEMQGQGIGKRLLNRVETYILDKDGFAGIRLETSSRQEYNATRSFYLRAGFKEVGRIDDFYALGDDLVTFHKKVEPKIMGMFQVEEMH